MKKLLLTLLLLSSVAIAQEKKYTLVLTQAQLEMIARSIQTSEVISAKDAAVLIAEITKQYQAQQDTSKTNKKP